MAVANGDILIAIAKGTNLGQDWVNRYFYRCNDNDSSGTVAQDLANYIYTNFYTPVAAILTDQWTLREIDAYLYRDPPAEFGQVTTILDGASVAQPAPSALCVTFSNAPGIPALRHSYKRLAGLTEVPINGNTLSPTTEFTNFADVLNNIIPAATITLTPVQCRTTDIPPVGGGVNPTVNRTLTGAWTYKLGTQNSRKPGYGT